MPWRCFIIRPSGLVRRSLRRYADGPCPASRVGYHDAEAVTDPGAPEALAERTTRTDLGSLDRADPRWPAACACGRAFLPEDRWQDRVQTLYGGSPDGRLYALLDRDLPPGAMWDADWMPEDYRGPEGKAWCVRLPGGDDWLAFGASDDGAKWQVTGQAPALTVHPSIGVPNVYHGLLQGGVLSEDQDGRPLAGLPRTA